MPMGRSRRREKEEESEGGGRGDVGRLMVVQRVRKVG